MFKRKTKQLFAIGIYFLIAILIGLGIYDLVTPDPSCSDGVQNQLEQGIDCGGQCAPCKEIAIKEDLQIEETAIVEGVNRTYDLFFQVKNPNNLYGSSNFEYTVNILGSSGSVLKNIEGESFILPHETKSIIVQSVEVSEIPSDIEILFDEVEWVGFREYSEPQLRFIRKEYRPITSGPGFAEIFGLLRNESTLDFHTLNIKVVLRDQKNEIIALHSTQMNTVKAGEERDFNLEFPERFSGFVAKVEAEAEADIVNADNYMRLYLPGGKFQEH